MRIALIGMSGAGKSFWSAILGRHGFEVFGCDDAIGRRLAAAGEVADPSFDQLGRWMGYPFEVDYARREARYLAMEYAVMDDLLAGLEAAPEKEDAPLVIDTTGSIVYTGDTVMQRLRQQSVVIYLSLPPARRDALRRAYERQPRPVVWRQHFHKHDGETDHEALKRCHARLVEERDHLYRQYAHLEIEWDPSSRISPAAETLLAPATELLNRRPPRHGL